MTGEMIEPRRRCAAYMGGFLSRDRPVIASRTAGLNREAWHIGASVAGLVGDVNEQREHTKPGRALPHLGVTRP
jgi:hypothetical protein